MEYAIKQLEQTEEILKGAIDSLTGFEKRCLRKKLEEVQTAILVLNASQEIVNIGAVQALKSL